VTGPEVPGGSELCLSVWFGTDMEMISFMLRCCCRGNPSFYLATFLTL
jgi:hypothetical protein